ncbi:NADP-dependent oxidoreductase [Salininema proteolyticum]|uniref:NADP-dependent oxidoreductase n=1 Tax=Salininema proteolyticum TaxID=1607685 RepID=A0ABV8U3Q9_9ACTN
MTTRQTAGNRTATEIRLASRPVGTPVPADFAFTEVDLPELAEGQILVRNTWMSVDPYQRERMRLDVAWAPPYEVGEAVDGPALGEVVESRAPAIPVGSTVVHFLGWRDLAVVDAAAATPVDPDLASPTDLMGPLGTTGLTAYIALTEIAPVKEGDVVFISAAAGAVGSIAGQLARRFGASTVIGSAGGPAKGEKIVERFGYDAAVDYKAGDLRGQLAAAAPEGIDVYIDNVGGEHLEAGLDALRHRGKAAIVGNVSGYNETGTPTGPSNYFDIAAKELTVRGVLVGHHFGAWADYISEASQWLAEGSLASEATVVDGLEKAPDAFIGMLKGENVGKMLVRLGE